MICLWNGSHAQFAHTLTPIELVGLRNLKTDPIPPQAISSVGVSHLTDTVRGGRDAASPAVSLFYRQALKGYGEAVVLPAILANSKLGLKRNVASMPPAPRQSVHITYRVGRHATGAPRCERVGGKLGAGVICESAKTLRLGEGYLFN